MSYVDLRLDVSEARELQSILSGRTEDIAISLYVAIGAQLGRMWNPGHNQEALCSECQHMYYRHFDSYEDMEPVGCKYCDCYTFVE
jgi:hypothetical protein